MEAGDRAESVGVTTGAIEVVAAGPEHLDATARLHAAVAAELIYIGTEPPVDIEQQVTTWRQSLVEASDGQLFVALAGNDDVVGYIGVRGRGPTDLAMVVAASQRGRGVGAALLEAAIEWAESVGSHKMTLQVWPHNTAAIRLYERFGFEHEGHLVKHWRRKSGEVWDSLVMGLVLPAAHERRPDPDPQSCSSL